MLTLVLLAGLWSTDCTQTQTQVNRGYTVDSYLISQTGEYNYVRTWFKDPACSDRLSLENESGTLKLGREMTGMFSNGAREVDFISDEGVSLGAMKIEGNVLKVARGMVGSSMRNTMLSIIGFKKK